MSAKEIQFSELPIEAQAGISEEQRSYIDEFKFIYDDGLISVYYADGEEPLSTWDGHRWQ